MARNGNVSPAQQPKYSNVAYSTISDLASKLLSHHILYLTQYFGRSYSTLSFAITPCVSRWKTKLAGKRSAILGKHEFTDRKGRNKETIGNEKYIYIFLEAQNFTYTTADII